MSLYFREARKSDTTLSTADYHVVLHMFMKKSEAVIL